MTHKDLVALRNECKLTQDQAAIFLIEKLGPNLQFGGSDSVRFYRQLESGAQAISSKLETFIKKRFIPGQTREKLETEIREWLLKKDVAMLETSPRFAFHAGQFKITTKFPQLAFVCTGVAWSVRLQGNWSSAATLDQDYILNFTRCGGKLVDVWCLADLKREISGFSAFFKNLFGDGEQ
ncbi:MAG: hypothetical protein HQM12_24115 [SAR324 cluster bacterium]|nr:hypothetical protein [SAR324 cluster bacterium]